jgi:hypothetical protein
MITLPCSVKVRLHSRDRHDPPMRVNEMQTCLFRWYRTRLQQKNAGNDLQAVRNPVLHFLQEYFLLMQQLLGLSQKVRLIALRFAALEDICWSKGPRRTHDPFGHKHCHSCPLSIGTSVVERQRS